MGLVLPAKTWLKKTEWGTESSDLNLDWTGVEGPSENVQKPSMVWSNISFWHKHQPKWQNQVQSLAHVVCQNRKMEQSSSTTMTAIDHVLHETAAAKRGPARLNWCWESQKHLHWGQLIQQSCDRNPEPSSWTGRFQQQIWGKCEKYYKNITQHG